MPKTNAAIFVLIFAAVGLTFFSANSAAVDLRTDNNSSSRPGPTPTCVNPPPPTTPIYGVTIEGVENLPEIVDALRQVGASHRPTTRIVFQQDQQPSAYVEPVRQISRVSDTMGEIADSDSMYKYASVSDYEKRVSKYLTGLPENVKIWEVGNEVNGEWVGWKSDEWERKSKTDRENKRKLVAAQFVAAFKLAKAAGKTTALTLYYKGDNTKHCWSDDIPDGKEYEMFKWVETYLKDEDLRSCLDYVLVSFYEDDCKVLTRDPARDTARWVDVFTRLSALFPRSKVGFGEFGPQCKYKECNYKEDDPENPARNRTCEECINNQQEFLPRYYSVYDAGIKAAVPAYVGGYFYWYFSQDMVPKPGLRFLKDTWLRGR